ncbi:MAG: hypothetical protein ABSB60_11250 [Terracidiphilus sp.]
MEILEPWTASSDSRLIDELRREMALGHVLEAIELSPVACKPACDEAVYALNDGSGRFALVHLTFGMTREKSPKLPLTWIFDGLEQWLDYMRAVHASWAEEDPDGELCFREYRLLDAARKF